MENTSVDCLSNILKRIDSRHLARLWSFYRDSFQSDENCLQFLFSALQLEPKLMSNVICEENPNCHGSFIYPDVQSISDSVFIPRRMINAVERLVSAARDMEKIRRGKDIFKIVYLVTCVETLQQLSGRHGQKKELLFSFFREHTSDQDKAYIREHFIHDDEDAQEENEDAFGHFIGVINELRNCATHEGEFWDVCFNNNFDGYPMRFVINIDLEQHSSRSKKSHAFTVGLSYADFERIFIRTCINYIQGYVASLSTGQ